MNKIKNTILILLMAMLTMGCTHRKEPAQKPNIIVFLADDLGYGETGVYGQQKIQTPHIDALAESGIFVLLPIAPGVLFYGRQIMNVQKR